MSAGDATVLPAPVQWAQRKDRIYLTICLEDVQDKQLDLTETRLTFSGVGGTGKKPHAVTIDFYKEVNPEESRNLATGREIVMSIKKKDSGPYWPRLTADSVKRHWLKTDFNRWVDEDEADARVGGGFGGGGGGGGEDENFEAMMSQFGGGFGGGGGGGFGGPGGFGGEDDEGDDLDDVGADDEGEGPPPAEEANGTAEAKEAAAAEEEGEEGKEKAAPAAAATAE